MSEQKKFYVYKHLTEDTNEPFYVGKGVSKRVKNIKRNPKHTNIVKKHGIIVEVVFETDNEAEAFEAEKKFIAELHTFVNDKEAVRLASNLTIGGEGSSGWIPSEETRKQMRDAHTGLKHSDESRAKMKDAATCKFQNKQQLYTELHGKQYCKCGCGQETDWMGSNKGFRAYIKGHKRQSWCKGLTKETDVRIANRSIKISNTRKKLMSEGKIIPWCKGLTKETDERVLAYATRQAERFKTGTIIPWTSGLTKNDDIRVKKMSEKIAESHRKKALELNTLTNLSNNSSRQIEIQSFLDTLNVEYTQDDANVIAFKPLDVYIPRHKLAVEYNELHLHSSLQKERCYHDNVTNACGQKGIRLIHVFEDDWRDRQETVKSMIMHKMNMFEHKIYARDCTIRELSSRERINFFNQNHLDEDVRATTSYGLINNNDIVAAISLSLPYTKEYSDYLEINRFCVKNYHHAPGALGKLTKATTKLAVNQKKKGLITYVDTRYATGVGFKLVGFEYQKITNTRFWWTDFNKRFNRYKFKPHSDMTEKQVAEEAGVVKIWGCINKLYRLLL